MSSSHIEKLAGESLDLEKPFIAARKKSEFLGKIGIYRLKDEFAGLPDSSSMLNVWIGALEGKSQNISAGAVAFDGRLREEALSFHRAVSALIYAPEMLRGEGPVSIFSAERNTQGYNSQDMKCVAYIKELVGTTGIPILRPFNPDTDFSDNEFHKHKPNMTALRDSERWPMAHVREFSTAFNVNGRPVLFREIVIPDLHDQTTVYQLSTSRPPTPRSS